MRLTRQTPPTATWLPADVTTAAAAQQGSNSLGFLLGLKATVQEYGACGDRIADGCCPADWGCEQRPRLRARRLEAAVGSAAAGTAAAAVMAACRASGSLAPLSCFLTGSPLIDVLMNLGM